MSECTNQYQVLGMSFKQVMQEKSPSGVVDVFSNANLKPKKPSSSMQLAYRDDNVKGFDKNVKGLGYVGSKMGDTNNTLIPRVFCSIKDLPQQGFVQNRPRSDHQSSIHQQDRTKPSKSPSLPISSQSRERTGSQSDSQQDRNRPVKSPNIPVSQNHTHSLSKERSGSQSDSQQDKGQLKPQHSQPKQIPVHNNSYNNSGNSNHRNSNDEWLASRNHVNPGNINPKKIVPTPKVQICQGENRKVDNKRVRDPIRSATPLELTEKKKYKEPLKKKVKEVIEVDLVSSSEDDVDEVAVSPKLVDNNDVNMFIRDDEIRAAGAQEKKLKFGYGSVGRMHITRLWAGSRILSFEGPYDIEIDIHLHHLLVYRRNEQVFDSMLHEKIPFDHVNNIYYGVREKNSGTSYMALDIKSGWKPRNFKNEVGNTYDSAALSNTKENPCKYLLVIMSQVDVKSCIDLCKQVLEMRSKIRQVDEGVETYIYADLKEDVSKEAEKNTRPAPPRVTSDVSLDNIVSSRRSRRSTIDIDKSSEIGVSEEDKKIYVCYPVDDEAQDVVTIHCGDIRRLTPGELLNDTLVDFGIRYMLAGIDPLKRAKIHAFTCFFYTKLLEGKVPQEQHLLVSRWTKNVDLFDMDYIIVPVNLTGHWSLFVIVKPGLITKLQGDINVRTIVNQSKRNNWDPSPATASSQGSSVPETTPFPYILYMDSLLLHAASTITRNLRNYLMEEWKVRRGPTSLNKELSINANNCITLKVNVPRQRNGTDCGVYVIENARRVVLHQPQCTVEDIKQIEKELFSSAFSEADANCERVRLSSYLQDLKPQYDAVKAVQQLKEQEEKQKKNMLRRQLKSESVDVGSVANTVIESPSKKSLVNSEVGSSNAEVVMSTESDSC